MKTVIIIGAGVSGLTAAHELIEQNYKVILIERNNAIGGLARTYQDEKNKICPYEYSWRAFDKWYHNVYNIMKRIKFNNNSTVYDTLVELQGGKKTCNKKIPIYQDTFNIISFADKIKILPTLIKFLFSCNERNIKNYSGVNLKHFIEKKKLSKNGEDAIGKIVGPYLGYDYQTASLYDLANNYEMIINNSDEKNKFNITSLPTSLAWFDPWIKLLKSKGLILKLNTEVISINISKANIINNIRFFDKSKNEYTNLVADHYINCTGPEILQKLLKPYALYPNIRSFYEKIDKVATNGKQIQLSVYYYIDKKVFLDNINTLAYLPDTPWLLMVLPTGHIWGDKVLSKYCNKEIKEIISIGICEPDVNGILIKKPWRKCTREEIKIETWYQLSNDKNFINNVCVQDNINFNKIKIIDFKMWDSYKFKDNKMDTYEPKWTNNVNTVQYRPDAITPIKNLYIGGSYSNTTTGLYSMESAAESGKVVAKTVCKIDNKRENIYLHTKKTHILLYFIKKIDSFIYKQNSSTIFLLIFLICLFVINKIK
jgi:UDP-galactopyranose mutase